MGFAMSEKQFLTFTKSRTYGENTSANTECRQKVSKPLAKIPT